MRADTRRDHARSGIASGPEVGAAPNLPITGRKRDLADTRCDSRSNRRTGRIGYRNILAAPAERRLGAIGYPELQMINPSVEFLNTSATGTDLSVQFLNRIGQDKHEMSRSNGL